MSDKTEQTMTQYVTDAVFLAMDNQQYHFDQIEDCHHRTFRRQYKNVKYFVYAETVAGGKQYAKQLSDGSLNLRHFSPKLMQVHLNDSYQIFVDMQKQLADIIEKFLPAAKIIPFLRLQQKIKADDLFYEICLTMDVLHTYRLDYTFSYIEIAQINTAMKTLWVWKQYLRQSI